MRWFRHPGRALDAYLDGELEGHEAARVAAHLERCLPCRRRATITLRIRRSLRTIVRRA
jgi:anti-sigma factor RsiW